MRLLLDQNLSSRVGDELRSRGFDTVHVRDLGMRDASDLEILAYAHDHGDVVVSQDSDFAQLLAVQPP